MPMQPEKVVFHCYLVEVFHALYSFTTDIEPVTLQSSAAARLR